MNGLRFRPRVDRQILVFLLLALLMPVWALAAPVPTQGPAQGTTPGHRSEPGPGTGSAVAPDGGCRLLRS